MEASQVATQKRTQRRPTLLRHGDLGFAITREVAELSRDHKPKDAFTMPKARSGYPTISPQMDGDAHPGQQRHSYGTAEAPSADAAVRKIIAEYQISDLDTLKRLAPRPLE